MKNNTVMANSGVEVYADKILMYADVFMEQELDEERRPAIYTNNSIFTSMLFYIADNINKPDNNDIQLLDNIFNIYIRLCTKYDNYQP